MSIKDLNKYSAKILIIDDESMNLDILNEIFEMAGYTNILTTNDPYHGVELYEKSSPSIVLLDINMPGMNGFDVLLKFKQLNYELPPPVIVLTAQSDNETCLKALSGGAKDFVIKPFNNNEILTRVNNLLDMHLAFKEIQNYSQTLEQTVQEKTQKLRDTQKEIIDRLGYAAEYRDTETAKHTQRVGEFSRLLAISMSYSEQEAEIILNAAPMHDLGKIGIPDSILLKEGRLDGDEWEVMKTHAEVGGDILKEAESDILKCARIIALTHHEKWDGSGYPLGLSGDEIPIEGQIVAIVDVFDALTSIRPYKEAWSIEATATLINNEKGKHFSPEIVTAFNDNLEKFIVIKERLSD
ncbi:MAG: response regulator [Proteobacteria bacterium]|nr:response regulator [Pseudomonadota bacterium]